MGTARRDRPAPALTPSVSPAPSHRGNSDDLRPRRGHRPREATGTLVGTQPGGEGHVLRTPHSRLRGDRDRALQADVGPWISSVSFSSLSVFPGSTRMFSEVLGSRRAPRRHPGCFLGLRSSSGHSPCAPQPAKHFRSAFHQCFCHLNSFCLFLRNIYSPYWCGAAPLTHPLTHPFLPPSFLSPSLSPKFPCCPPGLHLALPC